MAGVEHDGAIGFRVVAIFPEVAAHARGEHHQHRCVGEPVLAGDEAQRQGTGLSRSEEHTSELQSLMRISYAVFCLKKKKQKINKDLKYKRRKKQRSTTSITH